MYIDRNTRHLRYYQPEERAAQHHDRSISVLCACRVSPGASSPQTCSMTQVIQRKCNRAFRGSDHFSAHQPDRVEVTRPRPMGFEDLLTRRDDPLDFQPPLTQSDLTGELLKTS